MRSAIAAGRRGAATLLLLLALAGGRPAAAAADCPIVADPSFVDPLTGASVRLSRVTRELVFTTAEGTTLRGRNARVIGKSRLTAVSTDRYLTIILTADQRTGRARATAIERELGVVSRPNPRTKVDPYRHVHTLSVYPASSSACR